MSRLPFAPDELRRDRAREVFRKAETEFLELDDGKAGSITIHFVAGRRIRKVEWRKLADPEADA